MATITNNNPLPNTQYLKERLEQLGISDQQNTFTRKWSQASSGKDDEGSITTSEHDQTRDYKLFEADDEGNIIIRYFNLKGQPYRSTKEGTKQSRDFTRKRWRLEREGKGKYHQEAGTSTTPYFPPAIIAKYAAAKFKLDGKGHPPKHPDDCEIKILYLVEGEFKAFKGCMCGIDSIGIPGINGVYNAQGKVHEDIEELIITCKVQKIVLLLDADTLTVTWAEGKDLAFRPSSFASAIKSFRVSLDQLLDKKTLKAVYFMHIKTKYLDEDAKGLDDLLCKYADRVIEIKEDLEQLNFCIKYFDECW